MTKAVRTLFQRLHEHVIAGAVGAEHVVVRHQRGDRAGQQQADGQCEQDGAQRIEGAVRGQVAQRTAPAIVMAGQRRGRQCDEQRRDAKPSQQPEPDAAGHVAGPLRGRVGEVRATVLQPRMVARHLPVGRDDALLVEPMRAQRHRVTDLAHLHLTQQQQVQRGQRARVVDGRAIGRWQCAAQMHAVDQRDKQEQRHDDAGARRDRVAQHAAPGRAQVRLASHAQRVGDAGRHHQPQRQVGPEQHELHGLHPQPSRTRGSTHV
jgi:hypothetical protein